MGSPKIYTTTGLGPRKNREMAGVDDLVVYMPTAVKYNSLYIHHQIVHTSHFPIFSRPKPGGGVYLWGVNLNPLIFLVAAARPPPAVCLPAAGAYRPSAPPVRLPPACPPSARIGS